MRRLERLSGISYIRLILTPEPPITQSMGEGLLFYSLVAILLLSSLLAVLWHDALAAGVAIVVLLVSIAAIDFLIDAPYLAVGQALITIVLFWIGRRPWLRLSRSSSPRRREVTFRGAIVLLSSVLFAAFLLLHIGTRELSFPAITVMDPFRWSRIAEALISPSAITSLLLFVLLVLALIVAFRASQELEESS